MTATDRLSALHQLDYRIAGDRWTLWQFLRAWVDTRMTIGRDDRGMWTIWRGNGQTMARSESLAELFATALRRASEEWLSLPGAEKDRRASVAVTVHIERDRTPVYSQTGREVL